MSTPDKIKYKGAMYVREDKVLPEQIKFRGSIYKIADDVPAPNIEEVKTAPLAKGVIDRLQQANLSLPEGLLEKLNLSIQNALKQSGLSSIMRMASADQLQLRVALWPKTKSRSQPKVRPLSQANPAELAKQYAAQIASALKDSVERALKAVGKESALEGSLTKLQGKLADNLFKDFSAA